MIFFAMNDGGEFGRSFPQIYPEELELKEEHSGDHVTFLCIDVTIENKRFIFKLYDKRDDFTFSIVRMPHTCSNIPKAIFILLWLGNIYGLVDPL